MGGAPDKAVANDGLKGPTPAADVGNRQDFGFVDFSVAEDDFGRKTVKVVRPRYLVRPRYRFRL